MQTYVIVIKIKVQSLQKMFDVKLQNVYKDYCQALYLSLNLSLSLRDRADTIITFQHSKLFKCLRGDLYSSHTYFHTESIGLIRVRTYLPGSIMVKRCFISTG